MITTTIKKMIRGRQEEAVKSRCGKGDGGSSGLSRRRVPEARASDADSRPSTQTRNKGERSSGRAVARLARAHVGADWDASSSQVSKPPGLRRQNTQLEVRKATFNLAKDVKPKFDTRKCRMVYPVIRLGVISYLPAKSDARDDEIDSGAFIEDDALQPWQEPANTISEAMEFKRPTVQEYITGRTLYAAKTLINNFGKEKGGVSAQTK